MSKQKISGNSRAFGLGQYAFGAPVGNVYWVSSLTGTDASGYGKSPDAPCASLAYVLANLVTADNDDKVMLLPGHVETISIVAGVLMDKSGVDVIGAGRGLKRPVLTWSATASTFKVTADNCSLQNVLCIVSIDEVVSMFDVRGAFFFMDRVDFRETTSKQAIQFLLTTSAANDLEIANCRHFQDTAPAANSKWIQIVGGSRQIIRDNIFQITTTSNSGSNVIAVTTAATDILISNNHIVQLGGTAVVPISLVTNTSGLVAFNKVASTKTAIAGSIACASCYATQNFAGHTVNTSGVLEPGTDT